MMFRLRFSGRAAPPRGRLLATREAVSGRFRLLSLRSPARTFLGLRRSCWCCRLRCGGRAAPEVVLPEATMRPRGKFPHGMVSGPGEGWRRWRRRTRGLWCLREERNAPGRRFARSVNRSTACRLPLRPRLELGRYMISRARPRPSVLAVAVAAGVEIGGRGGGARRDRRVEFGWLGSLESPQEGDRPPRHRYGRLRMVSMVLTGARSASRMPCCTVSLRVTTRAGVRPWSRLRPRAGGWDSSRGWLEVPSARA